VELLLESEPRDGRAEGRRDDARRPTRGSQEIRDAVLPREEEAAISAREHLPPPLSQHQNNSSSPPPLSRLPFL